jgi:hypothetical protein
MQYEQWTSRGQRRRRRRRRKGEGQLTERWFAEALVALGYWAAILGCAAAVLFFFPVYRHQPLVFLLLHLLLFFFSLRYSSLFFLSFFPSFPLLF